MRTQPFILTAILAALLLVIAMPVHAVTRIWLGETAHWSNPDNWSPSGIPQNGDFLTFPEAVPPAGRSMSNDLANLNLNTITFTGGGYVLNGNPLTFSQGITDNHVGALNRVNCTIEFTIGNGRFNSLDTGELEISGTTTLSGGQELIITPIVTNITVSGVIQGNGSLIKRGEGALFLRGNSANTYTGPTLVQGGAMHLVKTSAAQAISADVTIDGSFTGSASLSDHLPGQYPPAMSMFITNSGVWRITNGATVVSLVMHDAFLSGSGLLTLDGDLSARGYCEIRCSLNVGPQTRTFSVETANLIGELHVFGNILGPIGPALSGISKEGSGLLILKNQNTYQGPTLVKNGDLAVQHAGALGSVAAGGETRLVGGSLYIWGNITCPEPIVVESDAAIQFAGTNVLTGPITLNAPCGFWGNSYLDLLEIRSTIAGPGGLPDSVGVGGLRVWNGMVRLSGTEPNTFGGGTRVSSVGLGSIGTLELAKPDNVMAAPGPVVIHASGGPPGDAVLRQLQNGGVTNVSINREGAWQLNGHGVLLTAPLTFRGAGSVDTQGGVLFLSSPPGTNKLQVLEPSPISYPTGYTAQIHGLVAFVGDSNPILVEDGATLEMPAQVFADHEIVKHGPSPMRLSSNNSNSLTGPVTVNAGRLTVAHPNALGTVTAGTFVNSNASLALEGGIEVIEPLTLNSTNPAALLSLGPVTNTWSGNIVLQTIAGIHVPDPLGGLTHFGGVSQFDSSAVSGPGGFIKSGPGPLFIAGLTGGNNYTGPTTIIDGRIEALRRNSLSSDIIVTGTNATLRTGRATGLFPAPTVLPAGASVSVENGALWVINGTNSETLGQLTGDGRLTISTGAVLTISNGVSCTFAGQLSGAGALNKRGLATLHFAGQSPAYTGPATVFDGTYKVDGNFAGSPVTVKLSSILRGSGAVGDVTVENGGVIRVDPRNSGVLGGSMQFHSVNFQSGGVLGAQFYGPHPTGGNDNLYVLNGVTLSTPALSSGFQYPPQEGDVIKLVEKIGTGAVSGAFSGFPEGAVRMIGSIPVVTSYVGGDGNDVMLTVTNLPLRGGGTVLLSSRNGSTLVPDDCGQLWVLVTNRGATTLTGLRGTLRSLTAGVLVTRAESAYPNLTPNARGSNAIPFQIRTEPTFACGGGAQFELVLTASNFPPTTIAFNLPGASGHSLAFDGRNDQVEVSPNTFSSVVNNFTIELWANPAGNRTETAETNAGVSGVSVPLRQLQRFAVFPDRGNLAYGISHVSAGLSIGRNGISVYEQGTNAAQATLHLPSRLVYSNDLSGWTHVALVYASRAPRLYVNGVLVRSGAASLFPSVHPSASLGGSPQADYGNYEGQLDEVRIWNVALSQSQIQSNMSRSLTGTESGLVTYFRCDEGSGTTLADTAPASSNPSGALTGGAAFVFPGVEPFGTGDCQGAGACDSCLTAVGVFDTSALESIRRLEIGGGPSVCEPAKPCPGFVESVEVPVRHVLHHFTNSSPNELCVTAQLRACSGTTFGMMSVAAYAGEFNINQPCSFYLGDDASTGEPFSFRAPPHTNLILVVTARTTNLVCDTYALELFGLPCPPPVLAISPETAPQKVRVHWSTAYPDFTLQQAGQVNAAFSNVTQLPVIMNGRYALTNITANTNQFYRLKR